LTSDYGDLTEGLYGRNFNWDINLHLS
jgi:hypothetical protein